VTDPFRLMRGISFPVVIGVVAVVLLVVAWPVVYAGSKQDVTFTVDSMERVTKSDGNGGVTSYYVVFSEEGETYANKDSFLFFKFNSSDIQGRLDEGKTYNATVVGWRLPFFSTYKNILTVEEVDP